MCDTTIYIQQFQSPCGDLVLAEHDFKLCMCDWIISKRHHSNIKKLTSGANTIIAPTLLLETTKSLLSQYFNGEKVSFNIQLAPIGTDFQKAVWETLLQIPPGKHLTYSEISTIIQRPSSIRAVANAIASNPISIIIPCHRVIGKDGSLTGYAGGINAKKFLLNIEAI